MNFKMRAERQIVEARNWWNGMDAVSQIYLSALIMTLVSIALLRWQPDDRPTQTLAQVAFGSFAIAFLSEAYKWTVPKLELPFVKLTLTALGVMAAATATGVSRILVNEATGQDPSYFGTTVALLVPISFVPVVAVAVLFVGGFESPRVP